MADIIRTWPASVDPKDVAQTFGEESQFSCYYFQLGKGKPKQDIERVWFTYRGRIIGHFVADEIAINDGSLPQLISAIDGEGWSLKRDAYVAVCPYGCVRLKERLFMQGFRGWRYFDLVTYRENPESRMRL